MELKTEHVGTICCNGETFHMMKFNPKKTHSKTPEDVLYLLMQEGECIGVRTRNKEGIIIFISPENAIEFTMEKQLPNLFYLLDDEDNMHLVRPENSPVQPTGKPTWPPQFSAN